MMQSGTSLVILFLLLNLPTVFYASADSSESSWKQPLPIDFTSKTSPDNLLQLEFQHGTMTPVLTDQPPANGLFATSASWLPDEKGISQSLRESIRQESLRILNQAFPNNQ